MEKKFIRVDEVARVLEISESHAYKLMRMQKEKRTDLSATLEIVGRDQPDQKLHLTRDAEKLIWQLDHAETELWKSPPDPLLDKIAAVITEDNPVWNGSATELVALLQEDSLYHGEQARTIHPCIAETGTCRSRHHRRGTFSDRA